MRILVVNCNTSVAMTEEIAHIARCAARTGTEIVATQPGWGPASAEGYYDSFMSAAAVLEHLTSWPDPFDAVVMAGFGEHGREGARQLLDVPVVDITEAGVIVANLLGSRFGVVTTVESAISQIEHSLLTAGLLQRCVGVVAADLRVLDAATDRNVTVNAIAVRGRELLDRGADVLVLGCAGFAGLDRELETLLGVPVVDCVAAAVSISESLVGLGKRTSKRGPYSPRHSDKAMVGRSSVIHTVQ